MSLPGPEIVQQTGATRSRTQDHIPPTVCGDSALMFAVHAADLVLAAVGLESVLIATYPVSVPGTGQQKRGLYGACYPVFLSCFPVAARLGCTYGQVGSLLSFFSSAFFSTAAGVLKIMPCVSTSM
eukprot:2494415-Rhodomonas_salina.1